MPGYRRQDFAILRRHAVVLLDRNAPSRSISRVSSWRNVAMMPPQRIRSSVAGTASVLGVREEFIDHVNREAELAIQGLFLRGFGARDPGFEANPIEHLIEKRGVAVLCLDLVGF